MRRCVDKHTLQSDRRSAHRTSGGYTQTTEGARACAVGLGLGLGDADGEALGDETGVGVVELLGVVRLGGTLGALIFQ